MCVNDDQIAAVRLEPIVAFVHFEYVLEKWFVHFCLKYAEISVMYNMHIDP